MKVDVDGDAVEVLSCPAMKVTAVDDVIKALRARGVANPAEVFAAAHDDDEAGNGALTVRELIGGTLPFTDGVTHKNRRKLLNQLVRPDSLDAIREDVILPSADRLLAALATEPDEDGVCRIDLVEYCERVFLHFAAKLIGLVGVETDEGMARLRQCVFPLFAGVSSGFLDNRSEVNKLALEAKKTYVEQFYYPSRDAYAALIADVEAGRRPEEDLTPCLLKYILTGADPAYLDEDQAILESIIFFVTSVGTSTQSVVWTIDDLHHFFERHPEERHRADDLTFLVAALEEALRLRPASVPFLTRLTTEPLDLESCPVASGQEMHVLLLDANRSVEVFGEDADEFNPLRPTPSGLPRYGVAFGSGTHQCFGLRVVLGNDGTGGGHVHILRKLLRAGARPDPERPFTVLERDIARVSGAENTVFPMTKLVNYPALLTSLPAAQADEG